MLLFQGALCLHLQQPLLTSIIVANVFEISWIEREYRSRAGRKLLSRHSVRTAIGGHSPHLGDSCFCSQSVIKATAISRVSRGSRHIPLKPDRVGDVSVRHRTRGLQLRRSQPMWELSVSVWWTEPLTSALKLADQQADQVPDRVLGDSHLYSFVCLFNGVPSRAQHWI